MKKLITLLMAAMLAFGVGWAEEKVFYTLTPATGSNNAYANNCDIAIDGITWNLTGNSQTTPWRIGGKSLSGVDRTLYSKTAMGSAITKVEVVTGAASSITVNSMQLIVAKDAAFSNIIDTSTATFAANSTITLTPSYTETEWSKDAYYKFVFNVTVSGTSNKYIEFKGATFYAESSEIQPSTAPTADVTFDPASGSTVNIGSNVTLALNGSASGIKYTTDGSTPTADSDTYTAPIAVTGTAGDTFTIQAIAFNTNGSDYAASTAGVATATYTIQAEPVAQPGDEVIFKYGTGEEFAQNNGEVMNDSHKLGITIDFSKGSGTNDPKWYTATNGNARVYTGNTITVDAGSNTIETVTFTYDGNYPLTDPEVDVSWNAPEWTVDATSGTLAVKNTSRISTIAVKLAEGSTPTVAAPVIEGTTPFDEQTTVTITAADGSSIYYTIDGNDHRQGHRRARRRDQPGGHQGICGQRHRSQHRCLQAVGRRHRLQVHRQRDGDLLQRQEPLCERRHRRRAHLWQQRLLVHTRTSARSRMDRQDQALQRIARGRDSQRTQRHRPNRGGRAHRDGCQHHHHRQRQ